MDVSSSSCSHGDEEVVEGADVITKCTTIPTPTPTYFAFWSTNPTYYPVFSHSTICCIILFLLATGTVPIVQSIIQPFISALSLFLLRTTFILTAIISFLHQSGALRRYALKFTENELSKNLNGALITVSDAQIDLWRGKVIAQDLIIHNKESYDWAWESPCLARIGRIEATLNFTSVIQLPYIGRILNHTFFDIYTVLVEDCQVFVEKRKNIFNFHLLDPSLDIPDAELIMDEYNNMKKRNNEDVACQQDDNVSSEEQLNTSTGMDNNREEERGDRIGAREDSVPIRATQEDEANKIVEKLVGAVSKIGKAANEGGSKGLQSMLISEKSGLVDNFKQLHKQKSLVGSMSSSEGRREAWHVKKEKGVSVMRELGKVVEKNVTDLKNQVAFLQKPPEKKEGWESGRPDYIRIGSLLLREARVFTKDVLVAKKGSSSGMGDEVVSEPSKKGAANIDTMSGWAKPIAIIELAVTGAELCPPMSARDPHTGMPVVGVTIDRLVDILLKRGLAEVARSNPGRVMQTAFGDIFSFVGENSSRRTRSNVV